MVNRNNFHIDEKIQRGYTFRYKNYLMSAYELLKNNYIFMFVYAAIYIGLSALLMMNKSIGPFINIIITGPFVAGFLFAARQIDLGQQISLKDYFKGFYQPLDIISAYIFQALIIFVGIVLLVIPAIYFAVALSFVIPFVIFRNFRPLEAIETSRQLITKQWFDVFIFVLILGALNVVGALLFGVGFIITLPFTYVAIYFAYKDIVGFDDEDEEGDEDINMNYFR